MRILYHIPSLTTIYAGRTIYNGYKNAFQDLGHEFRPLTADDDFWQTFQEFRPDYFLTGLSSYSLRFLNLDQVNMARKKGLKVLVNIPFWESPMSKLRVNETPGLKDSSALLEVIKSEKFGDIYYNICEQGDPRMEGFERGTGHSYLTVPLAADKIILKHSQFIKKFEADISYIGTNLPDKRKYFDEYVFPLAEKYNLKLYGQDWTAFDRGLGWAQRLGQYFNIKPLAGIRKPKLQLEDEANIYCSSVISINVHEQFQKEFGGDCNERTFKIPFCEGFEITDSVSCIKSYFVEDKEIVIANSKSDWFDKIDYFVKNPEKRLPIISAGRERVLKDHTYHNRVEQLLTA